MENPDFRQKIELLTKANRMAATALLENPEKAKAFLGELTKIVDGHVAKTVKRNGVDWTYAQGQKIWTVKCSKESDFQTLEDMIGLQGGVNVNYHLTC